MSQPRAVQMKWQKYKIVKMIWRMAHAFHLIIIYEIRNQLPTVRVGERKV